jgi:trans-aconitate methyltransferase
MSVPGSHDEHSQVLLREYASRPSYAGYTAGVEHPRAHDAGTYLEALTEMGWRVDAWKTR